MEIIVDLCNQHHGDIKELKRMALSAFTAGADVVKVQLMDSEKFFGDTNRKYRDISYDDLHEISSFCDFIGVEFMASVFDEERLEWLDGTYIKRHKIASRTAAKDPELCEKILAKGLPTIISTGMLPEGEFPYGFDDNVDYLFCVSKYPTVLHDEQLRKMPADFSDSDFSGYSDHTIGISAAVEAHSRNAKILEKHYSNNIFAQSRFEGAHLCSFDQNTLKQFKDLTKELEILRR